MLVVYVILDVVLVLLSIGLIGLVLLRRGDSGGGLAGALGGGGGGDSVLGANPVKEIDKIITWAGVLFFVLVIALSMLSRRLHVEGGGSVTTDEAATESEDTGGGGDGTGDGS